MINDLQLIAYMAARFIESKTKTKVEDAVDLAEEILYATVNRDQQHRLKHMSQPDKDCVRCRAEKNAMELQRRVVQVQNPGPRVIS